VARGLRPGAGAEAVTYGIETRWKAERQAPESFQGVRRASDIILSFVHMHVNRVLRTDVRVQELLLYDFLERFYIGQLARQRAGGPRPRG
jgi:hypothetical protein